MIMLLKLPKPLRAAVYLLTLSCVSFSLTWAKPSLTWKMDSFREFSEGTLADSGVNLYTAADGTIRLVNAFDFNRDGLPDIFLPCNHAYAETIDLSIYWDQPGYNSQKLGRLPTEGGTDAAVGDFNRDGHPDLVVVSGYNGARNELDAFIYWGGADGYSPENRTLLPTQGAEAVVAADLNQDGWPEIIIANNGRTYHVAIDHIQESYIYWNNQGTFTADNKTTLPTINGRDVAVTDLNADNFPDIILVSAGNETGEAGARIFWGSQSDYNVDRSTFLPGEGSVATTVGDLNNDGRPDIVLVNNQRLKGREGGIYNIVDTVQLDSFVYWNTEHGFDANNRTGLPTVAGNDAAIGDLDGDGFPELIFANGESDVSYVYWGSKEGFQARHRLALPTHNASAVAVTDLGNDGHLDLIFANAEIDSNYDVDSYIYWGGKSGPSSDRRQGLPTSGANAVLVADLNQQGDRHDIIFVNARDGTGAKTPASLYLSDPFNPSIFSASRRIEVDTVGPDGYSAADLNLDGRPDLVIPGQDGVSIYWGSEKGYLRETRTSLINNYAVSARLADFNRDGHLDILLSEWKAGSKETFIYYGSPEGFSTAARSALPVGGIRFHTIADFNNDGWIDVAFPVFNEEKVAIFWNSPEGFSAQHRTDLPVRSPVTLETADLNQDGFLDLIVPNMFDKHPAPEKKTRSFGGSPEGDLFVFWGSAEGFSDQRRLTLPGIGIADVGVADFNNDGRLDLAISSYHGGVHRHFPSYVYYQGENGFSAENVVRLPTNSASGVMTTDYNGDGWIDIFFANHHKEGSHRTDSYLYWGGPEGFSPERRLDLPANGPHLMTVTDPGNVYDRQTRYTYLSPAREIEAATKLSSITWQADTPPGTSISLQVRSASSKHELASAKWEGANGAESSFDNPDSAAKQPLHGPWIQFQAILNNPGGGLPILKNVQLDFE